MRQTYFTPTATFCGTPSRMLRVPITLTKANHVVMGEILYIFLGIELISQAMYLEGTQVNNKKKIWKEYPTIEIC